MARCMNAKDYLKQVLLLEEKINQKQMQYKELLRTATLTEAVRYDKEKVQTSLTNDSMSNVVIRYIELQEEINHDIDNFIDIKNKVITEIQALSNVKFVNLLFMRYIQGKKLDEIATSLNYSYQYARELHSRALKAFTKVHPELF